MDQKALCADDSFYPVVDTCRGGFGFTLLFEQTILSILPSALALLFALARWFALRRRPRLVHGRWFQVLKLIVIGIYGAFQVSLVALWSNGQAPKTGNLATTLAITACALAAANAAIFAALSYVEHFRNQQPSTLLCIYFLFTAFLDMAQLRTLWLLAHASALTYLFTVSFGLKIIIAALESRTKERYLHHHRETRSPEETSSIWNRITFYWLNGLLWKGFRGPLRLNDLFELEYSLSGCQLLPPFLEAWEKQRQHNGKHTIIRALVCTLIWPLLLPILPRLVLLALTLCQPLILHQLLSFLDTKAESPANVGYELIGAYALVYFGTAIATGLYWHRQVRFLIMVRGCIISATSWKLGRLNVSASANLNAAVTLMSTDIEVIYGGCLGFHEL
ncbi:hypothetical protein LTR56_014689 [Elasticomyces elasticus]|nr:hypothetical protein LTR56_014689 [Elasticomyces elasticus]KAK3636808.1 hypothetical protein LTR22_018561 [Elasticomyces elasticus]KAK4912512.1 hypothetical protein LTR49_019056 [Elasticomyces elasticus]KAK5751878.1 hypothetical protein LTS12_018056 [Elasticomyces elasticus]